MTHFQPTLNNQNNNPMKILKITRTDDAVQFRHEVQGSQSVEERDITAHEAPMASFDKALQALAAVAVNVLELGHDYKKGITVIACSFSYTKHGTRSAAISFSKELDATGGAHRMNTPLFQFDDSKAEEENGQRRQCSGPHAALVEAVVEETEKYANGDRQQRLLPLDDGKSEGAEPGDGDTLDFKTPDDAGQEAGGEVPPEEQTTPEEQPKKRGRKSKAAK